MIIGIRTAHGEIENSVPRYSPKGNLMMSLKAFLAIAAGVSVAGCDLNHDGGYGDGSKTRRYVIEAKVQTPSGLVTGRSSLVARIQPITKEDHQTRPVRIRMEAIPLRLPDGRILFVLSAGRFFDWDIQAPWVPSTKQKSLEAGEKVEMSRDRTPDFGFFGDIRKPNTLLRFPIQDWNQKLGPDVRLVSVTIQRSDEKTDNHVFDILPHLMKQDIYLITDEYCNGSIENRVCASKRWFHRTA